MQEGSDSAKGQEAPECHVQILWRPDTTEAEDEMMGHFARDKKELLFGEVLLFPRANQLVVCSADAGKEQINVVRRHSDYSECIRR